MDFMAYYPMLRHDHSTSGATAHCRVGSTPVRSGAVVHAGQVAGGGGHAEAACSAPPCQRLASIQLGPLSECRPYRDQRAGDDRPDSPGMMYSPVQATQREDVP